MAKNSDARLRAVRKYNDNNTKSYCLCFNKKTDKDIIEYLSSLKNKQGFIKKLIRDFLANSNYDDNV